MTIKDKLIDYLQNFPANTAGVLVNPDRKTNTGPALFDCFIWQEISTFADKQSEEAWEALVDEGVLKSDDQLRKMVIGEHIVAESPHFSVITKLSNARENLDKELFFTTLARRFKVSKEAIEEIAAKCSKTGKVPLQKRIVEV